jgi:hypothetical protein
MTNVCHLAFDCRNLGKGTENNPVCIYFYATLVSYEIRKAI